MGTWRNLLLLLALFLLSACETMSSSSGIELDKVDSKKGILQFSLTETSSGRLVVPVSLPNDHHVNLLLDTGATQSALFAKDWNKLDIQSEKIDMVQIHGMAAAGLQPVVSLPYMKIGSQTVQDIRLARLDNLDTFQLLGEIEHDGILGMDILEKFHLYVDGPNRVLNLIPLKLGPLIPPVSWKKVELKPNPYDDVNERNLHFMEIRLGNRLTPALLDTGSEFNLMNWETAQYPQIRNLKKRLREKWKLEGAIGEFRPLAKVNVNGYRIGQKSFDESDFLILDFDSLAVLGIEEEPFIILGSQALKNQHYVIDFENNQMAFQPGKNDVNGISRGESLIKQIYTPQ